MMHEGNATMSEEEEEEDESESEAQLEQVCTR